jgi:hypothetical protein
VEGGTVRALTAAPVSDSTKISTKFPTKAGRGGRFPYLFSPFLPHPATSNEFARPLILILLLISILLLLRPEEIKI